MKHIALFLTLFSTSFFVVQAEDSEKKVKSKITNVTVFMQGAQINRTGSTTIPKGTSTIIFEGVSPYINQQSIKASGKGKFTILDVQYRYVYPEPVEQNTKALNTIDKKILKVQDSINQQSYYLANIRAKKSAIETERNLLLHHPLMKGKAKPDSLDLLIGTMNFIEKKLVDLADRFLKISLKEAKMVKAQNAMSQNIYELRLFKSNLPHPPPNQPRHQVLVAVTANVNTSGHIDISYKVNQAGWSPWYDITAKDAGDDIELVYKAAVYQNTGVDWKNVRLRISNANPNRSNIKPTLPRWYVDYFRHVKREAKKAVRYFKAKDANMDDDMEMVQTTEETADKALPTAGMAHDYSQKMQNFSSVEFDIDLPYYIKSDAKTHFVTVQKHNLKAQFQHYLVPKLDKDAFVMARIVDWENLDLLVGNANIYFGNTFVGRTVIDPSIVSDTLEVSMGRFRSLAVKRTKLKSDTKKQIIGSHKLYTATYRIELRNNSANTINLTLEDQIPLTNNQNIEIELVKTDGGTLNKFTGLISWDLKLDPHKKKVITFTYTVKYPKEENITGL
ncbi:MAG: hypothetical protein ACI9JN_001536 [Bacteroidia bacterium]|jgi:uncharacterized protein (TIGR02231 family)